MKALCATLAIGVILSACSRGESPPSATQPVTVTFETPDGAVVEGLLSGDGPACVVLAHGGSFNKESWAAQARVLVENGFRVLAIDFRGYGKSRGPGQEDVYTAPLYNDVLGAVRYLHEHGAKTVSVVGGSLGGSAVAGATARCEPGAIERVVLLGARPGDSPEKMTGRKLFIAAEGDTTGDGTPRIIRIREQYELVPEPKQLIVVDGTAHAQQLFATGHSERVMNEILEFLKAP